MRIEEADIYPLIAKLVDEEDAEEANIEHGLARDGGDVARARRRSGLRR
jgi:hypothetical protein